MAKLSIPSPAGGSQVREVELCQLRVRRDALFPGQQKLASNGDPAPLGLAFSGGGIRSATFNLGVLQGLAERKLLPYVDYLSTVSGGGYIGCWLHSIVRNKCEGQPADAQTILDPNRIPGEPEDDPIAFLRKYSNYLAPHLGLFSPDFWTIASVWLRNMALNQLILIPFLAWCVLTGLLAGVLQERYGVDVDRSLTRYMWPLALGVAILVVGMNLRRIVSHGNPFHLPRKVLRMAAAWERRRPRLRRTRRWLVKLDWGGAPVGIAVACVLLAAYFLGAFRFEPQPTLTFDAVFVLFVLLQWVGGFLRCYSSLHPGKNGFPHLVWIPLVCALVTTLLMRVEWDITSGWHTPDREWQRIAFGPPLVLATWFCGVVLQVGLMGSDFSDAAREWLSTFGARLALAITFWIGLFVLAVYGPYWLAGLTLKYAAAGAAAAGGWIAAGISAIYSGTSDKTKGGPIDEAPDTFTRVMEIVGKVAPILFLAGFLLFVSLGVHLVLRVVADPPVLTAGCVTTVWGDVPQWLLWLEPVKREYWCVLHKGHYLLESVLMLWAACAVVVCLVSVRLNINEFSMHHFYKNRLVRCYLGAGRADRRHPNRLTGFDPDDDFPIARLLPTSVTPYLGPYAIVNCALNLNTGSELAQQERHGASFVFTPLYCGFEPGHSREDLAATVRDRSLDLGGFRATTGYMYPEGPAIGSGMAISGAAANPNAGYHTSAPLAFLMTILNVRLGWWLGNPRRASKSKLPGPRFALGSLLGELFAQSNGRSAFVNVSDGGHFDNLGFYELVRRRCPFIIASDAEADPHMHFEGLGGAIRKVRADFGVELTVDPAAIRLKNGYSEAHCVVGSIRYPAIPSEGLKEEEGLVLYLKASLTGDEPEDVQQYRKAHDSFPHESTADQFFTESQFESYRQLGLHVVRSAFDNIFSEPSPASEQAMKGLFEDLQRNWYPDPQIASGLANDLTERYAALMRRVAEDRELAFLDNQIFKRLPSVVQPEETPRKAIYFCMELLQLMEDVYFTLNFQQSADRDNPVYQGWMGVFRIWAKSRAVRHAWTVSSDGFNPIFREFFEALRDLPDLPEL
jgi:hypothetical protein